jgi:hypothetical protein
MVATYLFCLFFVLVHAMTAHAGRPPHAKRRGLIQSKDIDDLEDTDKSPADAYLANSAYDPMLKLNQNIFDGNVANGGDRVNNWIVLWCPHWWEPCQQILPHLDSLAHSWQSQLNQDVMTAKVRFARVDCATEKPLCNKYGVDDYPTVQHFRGGHLQKAWTGWSKRGPEGLAKFLSEQLQDASATTETEAAGAKQWTLADYLVPGDRAFDVLLVAMLAISFHMMSRAADHPMTAKPPPGCTVAAEEASPPPPPSLSPAATTQYNNGLQSLMPQEWLSQQ